MPLKVLCCTVRGCWGLLATMQGLSIASHWGLIRSVADLVRGDHTQSELAHPEAVP